MLASFCVIQTLRVVQNFHAMFSNIGLDGIRLHITDKVATSVAEEWLDLRNEVVALQDSITLEGVEQMEHVVEDVILSHVGAEPRVI